MRRLHGLAFPALLLTVTAGFIPTIPTLAPGPLPGSGIAAATDGSIFFADRYNDVVWRLVPGGVPEVFLRGGAGGVLQVDARGSVYGTYQPRGGPLVLWRAESGAAVAQGTGVPGIDGSRPLFAIGDDGAVIGWRSAPGGGSASAMTVAPDGSLLVATGSSVQRRCRDGRLTTLASGDPLLRPRRTLLSRVFGDPGNHLTGLAATAGGDVYVVNSARATVVRITQEGGVHAVAASENGWTPTGVAAAPGGVVYVLEYGAGVRVRRISEGNARVVALVRPTRALAARPEAWLLRA